jgi:bacteriocin-like protein
MQKKVLDEFEEMEVQVKELDDAALKSITGGCGCSTNEDCGLGTNMGCHAN